MVIPLQEQHIQTESMARECMWCFGSGRVPNDDVQRYDPCEMCQGTGIARVQRSTPQPAALPVASIAA
jgi:DnaJ-class molecular chaperone